MKERDNSQPLTGVVQIDDAYYGVELQGGKRERGSENKIPFVAAVSTNEEGHPIRMSFTVMKGFRFSEIAQWSKKHLSPGRLVVSDGLACFKAIEKAQCIILLPV